MRHAVGSDDGAAAAGVYCCRTSCTIWRMCVTVSYGGHPVMVVPTVIASHDAPSKLIRGDPHPLVRVSGSVGQREGSPEVLTNS